MFSHRSGAVRGWVGGLTAVLLTVTGCTSGDEPSAAPTPEESSLPDRSVGSSPTLEAKPVSLEVTVARTAGGRVTKPQRRSLESQAARVLGRYFDAAYLGGEWPRRGYPGAFDDFTPGAARSARDDRDLLTNAATGDTIERVVPVRKQASLDLLVPGRTVAGMTARIRLVFVTERSRGADQRVTVTGRLMLTRAGSGPAWSVFGYDVQRSAVVAKGASS